MAGVLLRCPNCGTSRPSPGECDACHEAQVQYFCTNHKPGLWLESTGCSHCGAKYGDPVTRVKKATPAHIRTLDSWRRINPAERYWPPTESEIGPLAQGATAITVTGDD
jgi:hypothetical protein